MKQRKVWLVSEVAKCHQCAALVSSWMTCWPCLMGRWGAKWTLLARGIQHTRMQYVSTYVGTHVGMLYTNVMNSVLLEIYSSYSASLYVYIHTFQIFPSTFLAVFALLMAGPWLRWILSPCTMPAQSKEGVIGRRSHDMSHERYYRLHCKVNQTARRLKLKTRAFHRHLSG